MINSSQLDKIKKLADGFLKVLDIEFDSVNVSIDDEKTIKIELETEEAPLLIGERGETLLEMQSLLKKIFTTQTQEHLFVDVDINNYKGRKKQHLRNLAQTVADRVSLTKEEEKLDPMFAWERRVIHLTLAERSDVETESTGQEPSRCVVIKSSL